MARGFAWNIAICSVLYAGVNDCPTLAGTSSGTILGSLVALIICKRVQGWPLASIAIVSFASLLLVEKWREALSFTGIQNALAGSWFIATFSAVVGFEILHRKHALWRITQTILFFFASAQFLSPHRLGRIERPYWFHERLFEAAIPVKFLWVSAGGCILLLGLLLLRPSSACPVHVSPRRFAVGACLLIVLFTLLSTWHPPYSPLLPPQSAQTQSFNSSPPPPAAERIALVKFGEFYRPNTLTDGAYLFHFTPKESPPTGLVEKDSPSDSAEANGVNTLVLTFSANNAIPLLFGYQTVKESAAPNDRFKKAWEVYSAFPRGRKDHKELLTAPLDRDLTSLENLMWTRLLKCKETPVQNGVESVRKALERSGKLSEKAAIEDGIWNLMGFLEKNTTGSARNFATAASAMLEALGVEARVVEGLRYDPGSQSAFRFKETILLTEAHRTFWTEWRVLPGDWTPLVIHPQTVLDDGAALQSDDDFENLMDRELASKERKSELTSNKIDELGLTGVILCIICFSAMALVDMSVFFLTTEPEAFVMRWMLRLLFVLGWKRKPGERWKKFEDRLSFSLPRAASIFREVREALESSRWVSERCVSSRKSLMGATLRFICAISCVRGINKTKGLDGSFKNI